MKFFTNQNSSGIIEVTRLLILKIFNDDIEQIKFNQTCHEVDSVYNEYEKDFINVLYKHAPIKYRYQRKKTITIYESGAQKSCIQKTNAIFSIYKMSG